ncbi:DegT/DnrJ/EryC1/StrS family aminotransferase [Ruminococcus gauvreauii]|uniref:DegT/DnrJ/EryC1/StrS family aminotransferase n=1 Tax=Ruminococcus gauvreauii TaxID=438033 RepID=UPI0039844153
MQFRDLKTQYQQLKPQIDAAIQEVLNDANFISGKQVNELEDQLSEYVGVKHCVTCANGTDALTLALMAWNIGPGDAVFVPDFTFFSSGEVVAGEGATPVFVDVCEDTFNISVSSLEHAIQEVLKEGKLTPRVILAVDLFGLPANYPELRKIADQYGLLILEDGAQGFGGEINGKRACSFGDISTTSFFPAKPLGCYGDGGAVFTDSDEIADKLRSIRVHGKGSSKYDNVRLGLNSRLDTLQAALLIPKLDAFRQYELEAVNKAAAKYSEMLQDMVTTPDIPEGFYSSWAQYTILLKNRTERDGLQVFLKEKGIPSMVYYMKPMHMQKAFHGLRSYVDQKITEPLCDRVLSLPMHPYLTENDIEVVAKETISFLKVD